MFNLPIPLKDTGARSTYLHSEGYEIDCDCVGLPVRIVGGSLELSGSTISVDFSPIEDELQAILAEVEDMNSPLTQNTLTTTTSGSIPAGVSSYIIINLGTDPTDPNSTINDYTIDGETFNQRVITFSNSAGGSKTLSNAITYDPNGNTLLIIYNS